MYSMIVDYVLSVVDYNFTLVDYNLTLVDCDFIIYHSEVVIYYTEYIIHYHKIHLYYNTSHSIAHFLHIIFKPNIFTCHNILAFHIHSDCKDYMIIIILVNNRISVVVMSGSSKISDIR